MLSSAKCYQAQMLLAQNVTIAKCFYRKMLPAQMLHKRKMVHKTMLHKRNDVTQNQYRSVHHTLNTRTPTV